MYSADSNFYICKFMRKSKNTYIMEKPLISLFLGWDCQKLLSYLRSPKSNLYISKALRKNKNANIMEKCDIWLFLGWNCKKLFHILGQHIQICIFGKF